MEEASIAPNHPANPSSECCDDQDLTMASRESAQHTTSIQNEAYRQALSELAGELYVEAYKGTLKETMDRQREQWNISYLVLELHWKEVCHSACTHFGTKKGLLRMRVSSAANTCRVGNVESCVAWLDHASAFLNPERTPHHSPSMHDLHTFTHAAAPPPPSLQEQWSTQVWTMPGEPQEVYLLRCLAHQSGVTLLSPHLSIGPETTAEEELDGSEAAVAATTPRNRTTAGASLFLETCVVVGLRVEPTATNLLQTGWNTQPCPHCPCTSPSAINPAQHRQRQQEQQQQQSPVLLLPLLYGGDTCAGCGRTFPLVPAWTRVVYLVLQRSNRTRAAAVAYGDGALQNLTLGATIRALLYSSRTEQQEPLVVVHSAQPSAVPIPRTMSRSTTPQQNSAQNNYFRSFYDQVQSSLVAQKWAGPVRSLDDVARRISPKLLGQTRAKKLLLLVVLYTLYQTQHGVPGDDTAHHPLHLLLLGPAKTGKSALLREVQLLMGAQADVLDSTVVRSGELKRTTDGASFLSALPYRRRGLLMAGACMTATTLVLDHLPTSSAAAAVAPLQDVLERQRGCIAEVDGPSTVRLPAHLIAAAEAESASTVQLAPFFALVATLTPTNSLDASALISQDVVAASRARTSQSRSTSPRSSSSASSSASSTQRSTSRTRDADVSATAERLTAEDVQHLLRRTADPVTLNVVMNATVCHALYVPRLAAAARLVEEAQLPTCPLLPPPSACRGVQRAGVPDQPCGLGEVGNLSASPLRLELHLRVLRCLSQARLMLETAADVRAVGWTAAMCDEVWQLYEHHLVTLADLLHQHSGAQRTGSAQATTASASAFASVEAGQWASWPSSTAPGQRGSAPKKLSKKNVRLRLVEELRCLPSRCGRGNHDVLPAEVDQLFGQLGGNAAFGDSLDMVMSHLQEEGLVLRCLGGWRAL